MNRALLESSSSYAVSEIVLDFKVHTCQDQRPHIVENRFLVGKARFGSIMSEGTGLEGMEFVSQTGHSLDRTMPILVYHSW